MVLYGWSFNGLFESIVKHSAGSYHQPNRLQWKWLCTITKLHPSKPPGFQTSRLEWSLKETFSSKPIQQSHNIWIQTGKTKLFQQLGNPQPQNVKALTPFKIWEIDVVERSHMENGNLKCFRRLYITEMNYRKHGQNNFSTYHISISHIFSWSKPCQSSLIQWIWVHEEFFKVHFFWLLIASSASNLQNILWLQLARLSLISARALTWHAK